MSDPEDLADLYRRAAAGPDRPRPARYGIPGLSALGVPIPVAGVEPDPARRPPDELTGTVYPPASSVPPPTAPVTAQPPTVVIKHRSWQSTAVVVVAVFVVLILGYVGFAIRFPSFRLPGVPHPGPANSAGPIVVSDLGPAIETGLTGLKDPPEAKVSFSQDFTLTRYGHFMWFIPEGYTDTYHMNGRAFAGVLLNPDPSYWTQNPGFWKQTVTLNPYREANGTIRPGQIVLDVTLPAPNMPRTVYDISLDIGSQPVPGAARYTDCAFGKGCQGAYRAGVFFDTSTEDQIARSRLVCLGASDASLKAQAEQEAQQTIYGWFSRFAAGFHLNAKVNVTWTQVGSNERSPLPSDCSGKNAVLGQSVMVP